MKRILRTLMLLLASLIALSPAAAQEDAGPYRLGTGDEVKSSNGEKNFTAEQSAVTRSCSRKNSTYPRKSSNSRK